VVNNVTFVTDIFGTISNHRIFAIKGIAFIATRSAAIKQVHTREMIECYAFSFFSIETFSYEIKFQKIIRFFPAA